MKSIADPHFTISSSKCCDICSTGGQSLIRLLLSLPLLEGGRNSAPFKEKVHTLKRSLACALKRHQAKNGRCRIICQSPVEESFINWRPHSCRNGENSRPDPESNAEGFRVTDCELDKLNYTTSSTAVLQSNHQRTFSERTPTVPQFAVFAHQSGWSGGTRCADQERNRTAKGKLFRFTGLHS